MHLEMSLFCVWLTVAQAYVVTGLSATCDKRDLRALYVQQNQLISATEKQTDEILMDIHKLFDKENKRISDLYKKIQKSYNNTYPNIMGFNTTIKALRNETDVWKQLLNISEKQSSEQIAALNSTKQDVNNRINSIWSVVDGNFTDLYGIQSDIDTIKGLSQCPDSWLVYNRSCYLISISPNNFHNASTICGDYGAHLAYIENEAENNFIWNLLTVMKVGYYWIGLTDEVVEGKWIWYGTNTTASFFDWNGGEPTNAGGNEHCVHVYLYSENNFNWNDLPKACTSENFFICEKLFKES